MENVILTKDTQMSYNVNWCAQATGVRITIERPGHGLRKLGVLSLETFFNTSQAKSFHPKEIWELKNKVNESPISIH